MSIDTLIKVSRTSRLSMEDILFGEGEEALDHPQSSNVGPLFTKGTEVDRKGIAVVFSAE